MQFRRIKYILILLRLSLWGIEFNPQYVSSALIPSNQNWRATIHQSPIVTILFILELSGGEWMVSEETKAFATRLPAKEADRILKPVQETNWSKSTILERGLRYYIDENPDNIRAFRYDEPPRGPLAEVGILPVDLADDSLQARDSSLRRTK